MAISRHSLRAEVFKLLYRMEFNKEDMDEQLSLYKEIPEKEPLEEEDAAAVVGRYALCSEKISEIDAVLSANLTDWTLDRVGKVELAILRLAVYEMRFDEDIPEGVAMNEAVELAKQYGQENAGAFVNAVLTKVQKA